MGKKLTTEEFIARAKEVHGDKYDYSLVQYNGYHTKIQIICQKHGTFEQNPANHISLKQRCPICASYSRSVKHKIIQQKVTKPHKKFIDESISIFGELYDYSKTKYINKRTKVIINCKIHGEFYKRPDAHLAGQGCPKCKISKGERSIQQYLNYRNIQYVHQKTFNSCRGKRKPLQFDFYIPDYNMCIEYDGEQHFTPVNFSGKMSDTQLQYQIQRSKIHDTIKNEYCILNNIRLIRIPFFEFKNIHTILTRELN